MRDKGMLYLMKSNWKIENISMSKLIIIHTTTILKIPITFNNSVTNSYSHLQVVPCDSKQSIISSKYNSLVIRNYNCFSWFFVVILQYWLTNIYSVLDNIKRSVWWLLIIAFVEWSSSILIYSRRNN